MVLEHRSRLRKYQSDVGYAVEKLQKKGVVVTYDDQELTHTNITGDSRGGTEWFEKTEQQVYPDMASLPAFHGRTDSSTETYADVMYSFMLGQTGDIQRLPKRRQERTYMLDLRLGGIEVSSVSVGFNRAPSRNPTEEAEAEKARGDTALSKARDGVISPDAAAQEMGYDSCYDSSLLIADEEAAKSLRARLSNRTAKSSRNLSE